MASFSVQKRTGEPKAISSSLSPARSSDLTSQRYWRNILSVLRQTLAVQRDRRQGIQPIADQEDLFFGQKRGLDAERCAGIPNRSRPPSDPLLVVRHKRVLDPAEGQQVGVDAARHLGRQPIRGD